MTNKQIETRLSRYYKKHFGECDTDEWYVNPAPNKWKFERGGKTITIVCDTLTGEVSTEG